MDTPTTLSRKPVLLSDNGRTVFQKRYLHPGETVEDRVWAVASHVAQAERRFFKGYEDWAVEKKVEQTATAFYDLLAEGKFFPNSPTLRNAGAVKGTLSACFVIPFEEDSWEGYCEGRRQAGHVQKYGGGTGFDFSVFRPEGFPIAGSQGSACGPVAFLTDANGVSDALTQSNGAFRKGANMGILRASHPDSRKWIHAKDSGSTIANFNISLAIDDDFLRALAGESQHGIKSTFYGDYLGVGIHNPDGSFRTTSFRELGIDPRYAYALWFGDYVYGYVDARELWQEVCESAWKTGDPGLYFIDEANRYNPTPHLGRLESTNPCLTGESLVYCDRGLVRVADFVGQGSFGVHTNSGQQLAVSAFRSGRKPVVRLDTVEGYSVRLTADHRVQTQRGWVVTADLTSDDEIALLVGGGSYGTEGNLELGRVLGWLVGDGTFGDSRAVLRFYGKDRELASTFAQYVNDIIPQGTNNRVYPVGVHETEATDQSDVRSERLAAVVGAYGIQRGDKLKVPEAVFRGTRGMQQGFLQALFTADGHVSGEGADSGVTVRLTSTSLSLLQDVQRLLLNMGMLSTIYQNRRTGGERLMPDGKGGSALYQTQPYHDLVLTGRSCAAFATEVGFIREDKQAALVDKLARYVRTPYRQSYYARVAGITPDGEEDVYDITEPVTHSFVANGLVVHNCGEVPLLAYEPCNLGSIAVNRFYDEKRDVYDWAGLRDAVHLAVQFLDDVVEVNEYPTPEIDRAARATRKIGLGVMGWHDLLIAMKIPYGSDKAVEFADDIMGAIQRNADAASVRLGIERGVYPAFEPNDLNPYRYRNATRTCIAPTGTIAIIADVMNGIEPYFDLSNDRKMEDGTILKENVRGYDEWLKSVPKGTERPDYLKTAMEIDPYWHVAHQAAFQKHVNLAVSKTINMPNSATPDDISAAYLQAAYSGCKGITIYRDGSRAVQVLTSKKESDGPTSIDDSAPGQPYSSGGLVRGAARSAPTAAQERKLPDDVISARRRFEFRDSGVNGYVHAGFYDDGTVGEVFFNATKAGSTIQGLLHALARTLSTALQYGTPLSEITRRLRGMQFEPSGPLVSGDIRAASSIPDFIAQYLERFDREPWTPAFAVPDEAELALTRDTRLDLVDDAEKQAYGAGCPQCGGLLRYAEGCNSCRACGYSACG